MIDIGAGMGRAVLLAAEMPFRLVVGVELNPTLAQIARRNLAIWRQEWSRAHHHAHGVRGCCGIQVSARTVSRFSLQSLWRNRDAEAAPASRIKLCRQPVAT